MEEPGRLHGVANNWIQLSDFTVNTPMGMFSSSVVSDSLQLHALCADTGLNSCRMFLFYSSYYYYPQLPEKEMEAYRVKVSTLRGYNK